MPVGETGRNLVFILSQPRSGSTLLSAILGNHADVSCPPEPWVLLRLHEVYGESSPGRVFDDFQASKAVRAFLTRDEFVASARRFAIEAYNTVLSRTGGRVLVDKTPRYYHILDFLEELFPEARKIWLKRNPLDVAASYKTTWNVATDSLWGEPLMPLSFDFTLGLRELARYFAQKSAFQCEVRYEDLVASPETEVRRLVEFCDLEFEPSMLEISPTSRGLSPLLTAEMGDRKIRETCEILPTTAGAWRQVLNEEEIRQLAANLGSRGFIDAGYPEIVTDFPQWFATESAGAVQSLSDSILARFQARQMDCETCHHTTLGQLEEARSHCASLAAERDAIGRTLDRVRGSNVVRGLRKLGLWGWLEPSGR